MIYKFYEKLVLDAPMWTLKHQVLWSCDTRAHDSFFLFKSTQCFQTCSFINSCLYLSPLWVFGKIFTAFTLQVYTHLFNKTFLCFDRWIFFKERAGVYFFLKASWLFSQKIYFLFLFVFVVFLFRPFFKRLKIARNLGTVDTRDYIFIEKRCVNESTLDLHTFLRFGKIIVK